MKLRLKVGFEHMRVVQEFTTLAKITSLALGGGDCEPEDTTPTDLMSAQMQFSSLVGG